MLAVLAVVALLVLSVPRICNKSVGNVPEDAWEEMSRLELYRYHAVRFSHPDTAEHIQEQCLPEAEPRNRQVNLPELNGRGVPFSQPNIGEGPVSLTNGEEKRCGPNNTEQRMEGERSPEVVPDDVEGRFSRPDIESECSPPPNGGVNYLREPNDAREQLYEPDDDEKNVEERSCIHAYSFKMKRYVYCLHLRSCKNELTCELKCHYISKYTNKAFLVFSINCLVIQIFTILRKNLFLNFLSRISLSKESW